MADIDYSKLSDEELEALSRGDYSKLSDATLQMLAGEKPAAKPAAPAPTPAAPADRRRFPMLPRDVRTPTDVSPGRGVSGLMGIPGGFLDIATGLTGLFGETETSRELRALEQKLAEKAPVKETYEAGKIVPQVVPSLTAAKVVSKIPVASKTAQALLQAAGQAGQAYAVTPSAPEPKLSDLVLEKPREEGIFGLGPRGEAALIEGGLGLAGEAIGPIVRGGTDFARSVRAGLTGRIRGVPTTPVTEEEKAALEIARKRGAPETAELSEAEKAAAEARAERNRIKAAEAEQKLALEQQRQALLARKKAAEEAEAKALETVELTPTRGKQELGQRLRDVVMSARKKYLDARNQAIGKFESGDEIPVFTAAKERESVGDFITSTKSFEDLVKYLKDRSSTGDIGLRDLTQPQMDAIDKVLEQITPKKRVIERVVDEAGNVTEKEVVRPVPISFEKLEAIRRLVSGQAPGTPELGFDALKGKTRDGILSKIESTLENFSKGFEDYKAAYAETSEPLDFLKVNSVGKKAATFQKFSQEQFQANPESVLDALLNNPSKTNADNLLKFVGNENKDEIEQVVLEALVNKAGGKASGYTKVLDKYDDFLEAFPTAKARLQEEAGVFEKATAPSRAAFEEATAGLEGIKLARESAKNRSRIASAAFERAESIRVAAKDRVQALNELDEDTLIAVSEAANKIPLNTSLGLAQAAALAAIAGGVGAVANDSPVAGILAITGGALGRKQVKNAFARKRKEVADRIETELRKIITDRSGGRAASIQTRIDNETGIMDAQRIANEALRNLGIKPGTGAVTTNMIYKAFATDKGADAASEGASEPAGEEGLVPGEEGEAESAADGQSYDIDAIISSRGAEDLAPVIKSIYEQESSSGKAENLDKENYAGAKGPMQVTRDTFDAMRNKGMIPEDYSFDNLSHLAEAGVVLIQDLAKRYNNDPEKIAAAYYGGPKAVTAQGINRNQVDKRNPKAPTVGQYADQVLARLIPTAEAKGMADGGLITPGNIDVSKLPAVRNPDGTVSTVRSMSINVDGKEVLIPTVVNGRVVSEKEAIDQYMKTRRHLGIFDTPEAATAYAQKLHESEAQRVKRSQGGAAYTPAEEVLLRRYADGGPSKRPTLPADRYAGYKQVGEGDDRLVRFFEAAARELPSAIKENVTSNADLAAKYLKFKFGMMSPEEMMIVAKGLPESLKGVAVAAMQAVKEAPKAVAEATPESAGKFAGQMLAGELTDPLRMVRGAGSITKPVIQELDVYHGTPHRFRATEASPLGEFDPSKIGTGEGAQAYGYGTYFAESPGVAKTYQYQKKRMGAFATASGEGITVGGKPLDSYGIVVQPEFVDAAKSGNLIEAVNSRKNQLLDFVRQQEAEIQQKEAKFAAQKKPPKPYELAAIDRSKMMIEGFVKKELKTLDRIIKDAEKGGVSYEGGASLYKADLPDEMIDRMLDWDKPLSKQSEYIKKVFGYTEPELPKNLKAVETGHQNPAWKYQVEGFPAAPTEEKAIANALDTIRSSQRFMGKSGKALYEEVAEKFVSQKNPLGYAEASEELRKLGIPGIKYADAGSRGQGGAGTRNFVVFPGEEKKVRILERK